MIVLTELEVRSDILLESDSGDDNQRFSQSNGDLNSSKKSLIEDNENCDKNPLTTTITRIEDEEEEEDKSIENISDKKRLGMLIIIFHGYFLVEHYPQFLAIQ